MDSLSAAQKAPLQEVALLMHEIYLVLARMRYLDYSCIHPGPHDLSQLVPTISSFDLDPRILYLYSILPYVTAPDGRRDFFQGSGFADFRILSDVQQGRNPFFGDDEKIRPWMTPLCNIGNHDSLIFYNARTHRIAIIDSESGQTRDHVLSEVKEPRRMWETRRQRVIERFYRLGQGGEEYESDLAREIGPEPPARHPDEVPFEDQEHWEPACGTNEYDTFPSRPAGHVLRDIVRWHYELREVPCGEHSDMEWYPEYTIPMYREHGWPGPNFNSGAFVREMEDMDI